MAVETAAEPVRLSAEQKPNTGEAAAAPGAAAWEGFTSRAPWDPQGCQTIVFFHVPKTGGESVNDLWVDMKGRVRLPWWKEGYLFTGMRITGREPKQQEAYLEQHM